MRLFRSLYSLFVVITIGKGAAGLPIDSRGVQSVSRTFRSLEEVPLTFELVQNQHGIILKRSPEDSTDLRPAEAEGITAAERRRIVNARLGSAGAKLAEELGEDLHSLAYPQSYAGSGPVRYKVKVNQRLAAHIKAANARATFGRSVVKARQNGEISVVDVRHHIMGFNQKIGSSWPGVLGPESNSVFDFIPSESSYPGQHEKYLEAINVAAAKRLQEIHPENKISARVTANVATSTRIRTVLRTLGPHHPALGQNLVDLIKNDIKMPKGVPTEMLLY